MDLRALGTALVRIGSGSRTLLFLWMTCCVCLTLGFEKAPKIPLPDAYFQHVRVAPLKWDLKATYHVALEHVKQFLHEGFRRHQRRFVQLFLSDVIVVVHWLKSKNEVSDVPETKTKQQADSGPESQTNFRKRMFESHLHQGSQHVNGCMCHAVIVSFQGSHNLHSNPLAHPAKQIHKFRDSQNLRDTFPIFQGC